jgi:uncharacterized protein (TIGR01777 family)
MKTIGITGGTGFVGHHLSYLLQLRGYDVIVFTRKIKDPGTTNLSYSVFDAEKKLADPAIFGKLDAVINLAGAGIADERWTDKRKKEIVDSRVHGTRFLVEQLQKNAPNCKTLISASATGYYGPDGRNELPFIETDAPYDDFLGNTCVAWENETNKADFLRTVIFRFGIVLGKESAAFPQFARPMSFGIMPILGSGRQIVSWIHVGDLAEMIVHALENEDLQGPYNAVAPNPVTHKHLMKAVARAKGGFKIPAPVPAFALKIMLGEMSEEVLKSCTVSADHILGSGFQFKYPKIEEAAYAIVSEK